MQVNRVMGNYFGVNKYLNQKPEEGQNQPNFGRAKVHQLVIRATEAEKEKLYKVLSQAWRETRNGFIKRQMPKDGIWAKGAIVNSLDINRLDHFRKRYVKAYVEVSDSQNPENLKKEEIRGIIRRTFTKDYGRVLYRQDEYPNGDLLTTIILKQSCFRNQECETTWLEKFENGIYQRPEIIRDEVRKGTMYMTPVPSDILKED